MFNFQKCLNISFCSVNPWPPADCNQLIIPNQPPFSPQLAAGKERELYLYRLCVVEVGTQVDKDLGHPGGHIIRAGQDAGTQTQYTCMSPHQVYTHKKN